MKFAYIFFINLILLLLSKKCHCFGGWNGLKETLVSIGNGILHTHCYLGWECCTDKEIPVNIAGLRKDLERNLYGQHLVKNVVTNAIESHWDDAHQPRKALALSFHGSPGVGKNYVAKFIQQALYAKGVDSRHAHHFIARIHFPEESRVHTYKSALQNWIKTNVTRCAKQLFIFDEVDKMPAGLLDAIKPYMDYYDHIDNVDYRKAIFIFLSNTGMHIIIEEYMELWKNGVAREDITLQHFEKLISHGAFNEAGGFHHSDTIKSNLIDHYIPFMPMDEKNVVLCIKDEFQKWGIREPEEKYIKEVMDFIDWGPEPEQLFSKTGCKRISKKVSLIIMSNENLYIKYMKKIYYEEAKKNEL